MPGRVPFDIIPDLLSSSLTRPTSILLGPANNLNIRKSLIEKHNPPDIVLHGLVTADDVEKLFEM